jgi:uncharacterized protein (TIGR01777 family)
VSNNIFSGRIFLNSFDFCLYRNIKNNDKSTGIELPQVTAFRDQAGRLGRWFTPAVSKLPQSESALDIGKHRRVLITGGTGFIGSALCRSLLQSGHALTVVSRNPAAAARQFAGKVRIVRSATELHAEDVFEAVINLAGAPVVGSPWTKRRKAVLRASRLNTTRDLMAFVRRAKSAPAVWVQASAIGYYGSHAPGAVIDSSPQGQGFAADLCSEWEQLTEELGSLGIRRVVLRFGLVFGRGGGALPKMLMPFRFGLGSVMGSGDQHVAWIHLCDVLRLIAWSIRTESASGIYNAVAPDCQTYRNFANLIGDVLHRPVWLRIPATPMRLVLGEMASILVDGPKIISQRLPATDFSFSFPTLRSALVDLCRAQDCR